MNALNNIIIAFFIWYFFFVYIYLNIFLKQKNTIQKQFKIDSYYDKTMHKYKIRKHKMIVINISCKNAINDVQ